MLRLGGGVGDTGFTFVFLSFRFGGLVGGRRGVLGGGGGRRRGLTRWISAFGFGRYLMLDVVDFSSDLVQNLPLGGRRSQGASLPRSSCECFGNLLLKQGHAYFNVLGDEHLQGFEAEFNFVNDSASERCNGVVLADAVDLECVDGGDLLGGEVHGFG